MEGNCAGSSTSGPSPNSLPNPFRVSRKLADLQKDSLKCKKILVNMEARNLQLGVFQPLAQAHQPLRRQGPLVLEPAAVPVFLLHALAGGRKE